MDIRTSRFGSFLAAALLVTSAQADKALFSAEKSTLTDSGWTSGLSQESVDIEAWNTFFYLMQPDHQAGPGTRNWEAWKEQYQIYRPNGSQPAPWGSKQATPKGCADVSSGYLSRTEKVGDVLDSTLQAVKADGTLPGTLKDQNGNLVRYEIRMNKTVFDYIVDHQFYNGDVQAKADAISYPNGSIIIKAAWKELNPSEKHKHFVTRSSCICEQETASGEPFACHTAVTGLVGFHVMHKVAGAPQWLWSTFEHVANTMPSHGMPAIFNNPDCRGPHCVPNSQTPDNATKTGGFPNQVVQILPIETETAAINAQAHEALSAMAPDLALLANYQLMSAQWPTSNTGLKDPATVFTVEPTFSANTTMETFAQSSSSCMGCHAMSRSLNPKKFVSGDFTFTLNNANPKPPGATCSEYDYSNSMFCSDDLILFDPTDGSNPADVRRGYSLISDTYEKLPNNVGNKLHCKSCHLHGGGDPNASWWVGMSAAYKDQPGGLPHRINGCFKRSMSGFPLCGTDNAPDNGCDTDKDMQDIIAYMDWLTSQYETKNGCIIGGASPACKDVPRGFPALTKSTVKGSETAGLAVFEQKCAFCHNDLGEGRYESDTYFRPALWGPDSFHASAGMSKASMASKFFRWNMPYTSGGLLSDQESMDLACFIDAQQRPGKLAHGTDEPDLCTK